MAMLADVQGLCLDEAPLDVIIEMPGGKTHGRLQGRAVAGLDLYGMAAGIIYAGVDGLPAGTVRKLFDVTPNEWTLGKGKEARAKLYAAIYPGIYDASKDRGFNTSDAIGVGCWHLRQVEQRALLARAR